MHACPWFKKWKVEVLQCLVSVLEVWKHPLPGNVEF